MMNQTYLNRGSSTLTIPTSNSDALNSTDKTFERQDIANCKREEKIRTKFRRNSR